MAQISLQQAPVPAPARVGNVHELPSGHLLIGGGGSEWGWSTISSYMHCQRWYAFRRAGYSFDSGAALRIGGMVGTYVSHALGLDAAQQGKSIILGTRGLSGPAELRRLLPPEAAVYTEAEERGAKEGEVVQSLDIGRAAHARLPIQGTLLGVEIPMSCSVGDDLPRYTGYLDIAYQRPTGEVVISDNKSTTVYTPSSLREYELSGQMFGYEWMGHTRWPGTKIALTIRLLEKVGDLRMVEAPIDMNAAPQAEFPSIVRRVMLEMQTKIRELGTSNPYAWLPRLSGGSGQGCAGKFFRGGRCPAWDACRGGAGSFADEIARPSRM